MIQNLKSLTKYPEKFKVNPLSGQLNADKHEAQKPSLKKTWVTWLLQQHPSVAPKSRPSKLKHCDCSGDPDTISRPHTPAGWLVRAFNTLKKNKIKYWSCYCLRAKNQLHKTDAQRALNLGILKWTSLQLSMGSHTCATHYSSPPWHL